MSPAYSPTTVVYYTKSARILRCEPRVKGLSVRIKIQSAKCYLRTPRQGSEHRSQRRASGSTGATHRGPVQTADAQAAVGAAIDHTPEEDVTGAAPLVLLAVVGD